jgi:6-phosphogluconolactonase (cycloisomerase 2 family)
MYSEGPRPYVRLLTAATAFALLTIWPQIALAQGNTGDVYVMTNQPAGNSVMVMHRDAAGMLTLVGSFASGGNGAGTGADPLGSQGSLVLSEDERLLFTVNAGSNSVSEFAVFGDYLKLLNTAPSGGVMPVSVAVKHGLVYVLNAGGSPNISGFFIDPETNRLIPLPGSTQDLPGGATAAPAQVSFSPDGSVLVVTEKGTNLIDTFKLDHGLALAGVSFPASGTTPFGFAFGFDNAAIISYAGSGSGTAALSSYEVNDNGDLVLITPALGDTQSAACWVVIPSNGRFAYTSNTASGTISSYAVSFGGSLTLMNITAAATGAGSVPIDMALSGDSRFLYVRTAGNGGISGFRIAPDGSLTMIAAATGVPAGAQGVAAR